MNWQHQSVQQKDNIQNQAKTHRKHTRKSTKQKTETLPSKKEEGKYKASKRKFKEKEACQRESDWCLLMLRWREEKRREEKGACCCMKCFNGLRGVILCPYFI